MCQLLVLQLERDLTAHMLNPTLNRVARFIGVGAFSAEATSRAVHKNTKHMRGKTQSFSHEANETRDLLQGFFEPTERNTAQILTALAQYEAAAHASPQSARRRTSPQGSRMRGGLNTTVN